MREYDDWWMFCSGWYLVAWAMTERMVTARHDEVWAARARIMARMRLAA